MDEQSLNEKYPGRMVYREGDRIIVKIPVHFRRRNGRQMIFAASGDATEAESKSESNALAVAIARAWQWQEELESEEYSTAEELASAKKIDASYVRRMLRLNSLAPEIVEAILGNRAPNGLSLTRLHRGMPISWDKQRQEFRS